MQVQQVIASVLAASNIFSTKEAGESTEVTSQVAEEAEPLEIVELEGSKATKNASNGSNSTSSSVNGAAVLNGQNAGFAGVAVAGLAAFLL